MSLITVHSCCYADVITPSSGLNFYTEDTVSTSVEHISFEEASRQLTTVFPVQIDRFEQAIQNGYNWRGTQDASLYCEIGFTPEAIVISGRVADDYPFVQTRERPQMPDWWRVTYGADGMQFRFDDPTSAARSLQFTLNLGSAGTRPQIDLMASPLGKTTGILADAELRILTTKAEPNRQEPQAIAALSGFRFQAAIPTAGLAEPQFFAGPLRISIRLHDADSGGFADYLMMEERLEKSQ